MCGQRLTGGALEEGEGAGAGGEGAVEERHEFRLDRVRRERERREFLPRRRRRHFGELAAGAGDGRCFWGFSRAAAR